MVLRFEHDPEAEFYYYISTIGSVIVFISVIFLMAHSLYHYFRIFVSAKKEDDAAQGQSRITYIVFFITCFITLYICLIYTARSNLLLGQSPDAYSHWKCEFFQLSSYGLVALQQLCIYFLFIFRIETSFEGTVYQYPSRLYRTLYISLCVSFCIVVPVVFLSCYSGNRAEYVLYYFEDRHMDQMDQNGSDLYIWCDIMVEDHRYSLDDASDPRRIFFTVGTLYGIVSVLLYDVALLYLFTKRLYSLQIELMQQHIAEMLPDAQFGDSQFGDTQCAHSTQFAVKVTLNVNGQNVENDHFEDDGVPKTSPTLSGSTSAPISVANTWTVTTVPDPNQDPNRDLNREVDSSAASNGLKSEPDGDHLAVPHIRAMASSEDGHYGDGGNHHGVGSTEDSNRDSMQNINVPVPAPRAHSVPMEEVRTRDRVDSKSRSRSRSVDRHSDPEIGGRYHCHSEQVLSIKRVEMEAKAKNESARRIMNLHKLIKQHTILVWIQIVSYIAWSLSVVIVSSWMWIEVIWVLLINNVCLWLMFGITEKYWKFSTHWLCCALCYLDRNKDIGHRNGICFC